MPGWQQRQQMSDQAMDIDSPVFVSWCSIGAHGEVCPYSPQELIIGSHGEVRGPLGTHPNDLDEDGIMLMDKTLNLEIYAQLETRKHDGANHTENKME